MGLRCAPPHFNDTESESGGLHVRPYLQYSLESFECHHDHVGLVQQVSQHADTAFSNQILDHAEYWDDPLTGIKNGVSCRSSLSHDESSERVSVEWPGVCKTRVRAPLVTYETPS